MSRTAYSSRTPTRTAGRRPRRSGRARSLIRPVRAGPDRRSRDDARTAKPSGPKLGDPRVTPGVRAWARPSAAEAPTWLISLGLGGSPSPFSSSRTARRSNVPQWGKWAARSRTTRRPGAGRHLWRRRKQREAEHGHTGFHTGSACGPTRRLVPGRRHEHEARLGVWGAQPENPPVRASPPPHTRIRGVRFPARSREESWSSLIQPLSAVAAGGPGRG